MRWRSCASWRSCTSASVASSRSGRPAPSRSMTSSVASAQRQLPGVPGDGTRSSTCRRPASPELTDAMASSSAGRSSAWIWLSQASGDQASFDVPGQGAPGARCKTVVARQLAQFPVGHAEPRTVERPFPALRAAAPFDGGGVRAQHQASAEPSQARQRGLQAAAGRPQRQAAGGAAAGDQAGEQQAHRGQRQLPAQGQHGDHHLRQEQRQRDARRARRRRQPQQRQHQRQRGDAGHGVAPRHAALQGQQGALVRRPAPPPPSSACPGSARTSRSARP